MATIQNRPFSKDYSGLINQSVVAGAIFLITISAHEYMRRKRRGKPPYAEPLGSVETWEFGYLYQGRSWARRPSPPLPRKYILGWVKQVLTFPEDQFNQLRGVDAALYIRWIRACFWFTVIQAFTTLVILFPIHVTFSDGSVSPKSMTRASISSLVTTKKGLSLLWIHIILLTWITFTWFGVLYWICRGAFHFRAQNILASAEKAAKETRAERRAQYDPHPHPHPQYPFHALPPLDEDHSNRGLRLRTVMVTNISPALRTDKDLKEYFEYYLSRRVALPAIGINSSVQPGFVNKLAAFIFNYARRVTAVGTASADGSTEQPPSPEEPKHNSFTSPVIDRVVLVRKMSDLASMMERREEILRLLETAHIKLARKALTDVQTAIRNRGASPGLRHAVKRMSVAVMGMSPLGDGGETGGEARERTRSDDGTEEGEDRMELLIRTLGPYLPSLETELVPDNKDSGLRARLRRETSDVEMGAADAMESKPGDKTVWDALLSLPRSTLDAYQPLIHLSSIFRGKTVPAIDYYTAKLQIITNMITEKRSMPQAAFDAMSTAFVTFVDPADARRACKFLAVHPESPIECLVTMAPCYEDLDWTRLMKTTFRVEFVKDWVVELGVWAFTISWVFPVSFFVGLVNIQNLSTLWPGLLDFLKTHSWEEELLQSFVPTVLVALLSLLIPLLLLLIAKRAHTIATLSALHDRIMTRYYKFLVVNVLVFFCVGTAALQSFLLSFKTIDTDQLASVIAQSFPVAGPFYVGWFIFTTAMHGGVELALFGVCIQTFLPLIVYPATRRQVTPRKRAMGIRPRTFNYYYWLPNHVLVMHVLLVFSLLNPLVIPFALVYFAVQRTVIKNQLLHVYAKNYEGNGKLLLIRMVRYSLDGLILSQVVFLAYMVVNKKTVNVAISAVLIIVTAAYKMFLTRLCRNRFERDDILEAQVVCGTGEPTEELIDEACPDAEEGHRAALEKKLSGNSTGGEVWPWNLPVRLSFAYSTIASRPRKAPRHHPNPFKPSRRSDSIAPLNVMAEDADDGASPSSSAPAGAWREPSDNMEFPTENPQETPAVVTRHSPHPRWEDESSPNHTYENPYYTRDIDNFLWLPADPLETLNLDDTINLRMSLTTQPGAGRLGPWRDEDFIETGLSLNLATSFGSIEEDEETGSTTNGSFYRRLDGSEQIRLPPVIASRVAAGEDDVETAGPIQQRTTKRRKSSIRSNSGTSHLSVGRADDPGSSEYRSTSIGSAVSNMSSIGSPPAFMLPTDPRRRNRRAMSMDHEMGVRRPNRIPSFGARSTVSVVDPKPGTTPPVYSHGTMSRTISVHDAVYGVAIVEEEDALLEEHEREAEEAEQLKQPKTWLTAWMFRTGSSTTVKTT
ncbi:uncharacterized protein BXZ73DRAFT_107327 [Epithele typhae]|uniref:uncharacterized protein n=1 Tax=Epithele typhae TaxID=378194 RepID=UPI002007F864|nr:uncharacterized protein BXZ73DRAFT_107327 [Epithele typhae]KAH9912692.1 hypothetical protein BXZ73DRAFT_107327 [Epithele typhae]